MGCICSVSCNSVGKWNNQGLKSLAKWTWELPDLAAGLSGCRALGRGTWNTTASFSCRNLHKVKCAFTVGNEGYFSSAHISWCCKPCASHFAWNWLLKAGGLWKILESLANDRAEDSCSVSPTQTFWQSMEVSVSSLSQWAEHFVANYRPDFVPVLLLLRFCTAY